MTDTVLPCQFSFAHKTHLSLLQKVWKDFCKRLFAVMKDHRGDGDWSVVGKTDKQDYDWRALAKSVADTTIKDLFRYLASVFRDYAQSGKHSAVLLVSVFKTAFWPIMTVAYLASVWNVYRSFASPCQQRDRIFMEVAYAYESLLDGGLAHWREHSYYVNTPDFLYRFFAIHAACCLCTLD
jgi:hypothetical protein